MLAHGTFSKFCYHILKISKFCCHIEKRSPLRTNTYSNKITLNCLGAEFQSQFHSSAARAFSKAKTTTNKMHQTKIGQFFKKAESPTGSPVKKPELQIKQKKPKPKPLDDEENGEENGEGSDGDSKSKGAKKVKKTLWKIGGGGGGGGDSNGSSGSGRKRKSKDTVGSDDESPGPKAKGATATKKQRRRIVVESSSEDEGEKTVNGEEKGDSQVDEANGNGKLSEGEEDMELDTKEKSNTPSPQKEKESPKAKDKTKTPSPKKEKSESPSPQKEKESPKTKEEKEVKSKSKSTADSKSKASSKSDSKSKAKDTKPKSPPQDKDTETKTPPPKDVKPFAAMMGAGANLKGWKEKYDPSKSRYHPIDDASWERGQKVPYLALARTLEVIEATSSRLKFIEILSNYFRSVILLSPDDLLLSVYLCLNKLAPAYEGVELGVAETNVMKAIAEATGRSLQAIKTDALAMGDLGLVAESSRTNQKTLFQKPPLTVAGVFTKLKEIAAMTGQASHKKKISMITSMLVACKFSEARYLTRSLLGKLRIGLAEQSLLQALGQATFLTPPDQDMSEWPPKIIDSGKKLGPEALKAKIDEQSLIIKTCFCECPSYDILVKALVEEGVSKLPERCKLTPGIPPRPMLAQPTKGVADVLDRFDGLRFTCEYKYDGERAQVHLLEDGSIHIYSRNQEDNTSKYPDIISRFKDCIKGDVKTCIIDSEAVAWDLEKETILPFQVLSTRKRKDANEKEIKVQVCVFAFDLIYLNGESLVKEPLVKRREILQENFTEIPGQFMFATSLDTKLTEEVQEFLEESIKGNCEGLMVKTLDERASYELAKRSQKWLKLKKDYLECGGDSLDLAVIGGFAGKGKRTGTYGGFLLACYDPDEEAFQTICKIGTGFSDEDLQKHSETLKENVIPKPKSYYRYNSQLEPDYWFDAVQVWEVKCADLSLSPVHTAGEGLVDPQRGISLRFPRFLRVREDKNAEDATTSQQVADMYKNQEQVKNSDKKDSKGGDDDDFY